MSCSSVPIHIFLDHCTALRFISLLAWMGYVQALLSLGVSTIMLTFSLEMENVHFFHLNTSKPSPPLLVNRVLSISLF